MVTSIVPKCTVYTRSYGHGTDRQTDRQTDLSPHRRCLVGPRRDDAAAADARLHLACSRSRHRSGTAATHRSRPLANSVENIVVAAPFSGFPVGDQNAQFIARNMEQTDRRTDRRIAVHIVVVSPGLVQSMLQQLLLDFTWLVQEPRTAQVTKGRVHGPCSQTVISCCFR